MYTNEQINFILNKIKEEKNYKFLINFFNKNIENFNDEQMKDVVETILSSNDYNIIFEYVNASLYVDKYFDIILNKLKELGDIHQIYLLGEFIKDEHSNKNNIEVFDKIKDIVLKEGSSFDILEMENIYYRFFEHIQMTELNRWLDTTNREDSTIYEKKVIKFNRIFKRMYNKAMKRQKEIGIKQRLCTRNSDLEFIYRDKYSWDMVRDFTKFIKEYKEYFEKEDEKELISIIKYILKNSYNDINRGVWGIDYKEREDQYLVKPLLAFVEQFEGTEKEFLNEFLKISEKVVSDKFAQKKEFPFEEIYINYKKRDINDKYSDGERVYNLVKNSIGHHNVNFNDFEDFLMKKCNLYQYYYRSTYLCEAHEWIKGINKEKIEDFLFNYIDKYKDENNNVVLNDNEKGKPAAALRNLLRLSNIKYTKEQIENKYIENGIIYNGDWKGIINYDAPDLKKWEDFFCQQSAQNLSYFIEVISTRASGKIDLEKCINNLLSKEDLTSEDILKLVDIDNINLVALKELLIAKKEDEYIKQFNDNTELQNQYYEQLLNNVEAINTPYKYVLKKDNK